VNPTAMAHDRWRQIEELFHVVVDLPESQRDAFLSEHCGSDAQLRTELETLLASDYGDSPLIAGIVDEAEAGLMEGDS
jgi:hypothetical protein